MDEKLAAFMELESAIRVAANSTPRKYDNCIANTRTHRASHETFSENMKQRRPRARFGSPMFGK
jgi:hypothetical protein